MQAVVDTNLLIAGLSGARRVVTNKSSDVQPAAATSADLVLGYRLNKKCKTRYKGESGSSRE